MLIMYRTGLPILRVRYTDASTLSGIARKRALQLRAEPNACIVACFIGATAVTIWQGPGLGVSAVGVTGHA